MDSPICQQQTPCRVTFLPKCQDVFGERTMIIQTLPYFIKRPPTGNRYSSETLSLSISDMAGSDSDGLHETKLAYVNYCS